ncbi:MAG: hypothetical protein QM680_07375 [Luteolibacter sp.]
MNTKKADVSGNNPTSGYPPEAFYPIFQHFPKEGDAVICGGQAVHILASVFLTEEEISDLLGEGGSATSADMDIVATPGLQKAFELGAFEGKDRLAIKAFGDTRQSIRFSIIPAELSNTRIDVLRAIKGVHLEKDKVFEDALELDTPFKVINPITLMIAKAENCASLDQNSSTGKRNDFQHLAITVHVVRRFLAEYIRQSDPEEKQDQRELINLLKKIHKAAKSRTFVKGFQMAGLKLRHAVPSEEIERSSLETLKNYFNRSFLPAIQAINNPPPDEYFR